MKEPFDFEYPTELLNDLSYSEECPLDFEPKISYAKVSYQVMANLSVLKQLYSGTNIFTALLYGSVARKVMVNTIVKEAFVAFMYVMKGEVSFQMQGRPERVVIDQGKCFILYVPAGVYSSPWLPGKCTLAYFVLHPRLVAKIFGDYPELHPAFNNLLQQDPEPRLYHVCNISKSMQVQLRKLGSYQQQRKLVTESAILAMFSELLETQLQQLNRHQYSSVGTLEIAMRVYEYIRDHAILGPLPKVEEIADHHHIGHRTLLREFKNRFGITLKDFITQEKMDAAHYLLAKDHLSVTDVSQRLGYGDPQSFSRKFRNHFNYSPSDAVNHPNPRI
ncbi:helix-turn-helix transcriptional regulator [Pedobacter psychroterrae]|uniref:AraC family transcriptional regulator n=1 Tax=Pedobacter psychroterrae TaxID=2530453 RepID=A0A4R0NTF1_9SPHI|nr:helix-turn-helix transcriptional regulator [Pedobacter psychroterrae]TCD02725.1 AraC family transcriptional regulator [Pedobacter psychroterrae]